MSSACAPESTGASCRFFSYLGFGKQESASNIAELDVVKSVVVPRIVAHEEELDRLEALFAELGFSSGESWKDLKSRGLPMLAPLGALEFYHGQPPAPADVIVEVEDLKDAVDTVRRHGMRIVAETQRTHWGADLFVALIGGCHIAFFKWAHEAEIPESKAA